MLTDTVCTGINIMLPRPNCPVLNPWAKLYALTARVLLGAYLRPRIRRRALRAVPRPTRIVLFGNARREIPLVELAIIVGIELVVISVGRRLV